MKRDDPDRITPSDVFLLIAVIVTLAVWLGRLP